MWYEVKAIGRSLGGYALGYGFLTVFFAAVYASLYRWNSDAFKSIPAQFKFVDYWYFSLSLLTTLGSDVVPSSPAAKIVVALEVLTGIAWTVVVFAAVLTTAQRGTALPSSARKSSTTGS